MIDDLILINLIGKSSIESVKALQNKFGNPKFKYSNKGRDLPSNELDLVSKFSIEFVKALSKLEN